MDGGENARTQATRAFIRNLHKRAEIELPHCLWDERLTSAQVEKFLIEGLDMTRAKRKKVVDQMAAVVILQSALDTLDVWNAQIGCSPASHAGFKRIVMPAVHIAK